MHESGQFFAVEKISADCYRNAVDVYSQRRAAVEETVKAKYIEC